jgi:histidyl-tRNA synthetase
VDLIDKLKTDERLSQNKLVMQGLDEMRLLLKYCDLYGVLDKV